jgi:creatinine amidohydrolase
MQRSNLSQKTYKQLRSNVIDIAILPWGATEPHGFHLPYGTDIYESKGISFRSAEIASDRGVNSVVLPCIPYGVQNEGQRNVPGCINIRPTTQLAILEDIVTSLMGQSIQKLVIVNSHGGNDFKFAIRELQLLFPEMLVVTVDWWKHPVIKKIVANPGDHAGALETSVMMYLKPELVRPMEEAGTGKSVGFNIEALNSGWAWTPRDWSEVSEDTGVGDPSSATLEMGRAVVDAITEDIAVLIEELVKEANIYQNF